MFDINTYNLLKKTISNKEKLEKYVVSLLSDNEKSESNMLNLYFAMKRLYSNSKKLYDKVSFDNFISLEDYFFKKMKWYKKIIKDSNYEIFLKNKTDRKNHKRNKLKKVKYSSSYSNDVDIKPIVEKNKIEKPKVSLVEKSNNWKIINRCIPSAKEEIKKKNNKNKKNISITRTKLLKYINWKIDFSDLDISWNEIIVWEILKRGIIDFEIKEEAYNRLKRLYILYSDEHIESIEEINTTIKKLEKLHLKWYIPPTHVIYNRNWGK